VTPTDEQTATDPGRVRVVPSPAVPAGDLRAYDFTVDQARRAAQKGHPARVIWLTGLPGSGKSTLANQIDRRVVELGVHSYVLDGDSLRAGLSSDLGFSAADRRENVRRVAQVAHLMYDAGLVVIVALVSPFQADRDLARSLFPADDFVEVWVDTPVEVCADRDPKGLYAKAAAGNLENMTGRGQRYEPPVQPDLVVHGTGDVAANAAMVVDAVLGATLPVRS
jgi:bifunctional enzyme CysN/CysC